MKLPGHPDDHPRVQALIELFQRIDDGMRDLPFYKMCIRDSFFLGLRLIYGLGAVTNLNSGYSWGIWVAVDIFIGTALGCGGFSMAILVYIFNRGEYHLLVRPALLGGLFGYTLGGISAFTDLGRYWQAYNILLPWHWQPNSVMFEIALCLLAYTGVVWIEFAPVRCV